MLQSARSVSVWNKSSGKRRRGSTRSVCASWRSKNGNSVPVSRRSKSANDAVRRRGELRRKLRYENNFLTSILSIFIHQEMEV